MSKVSWDKEELEVMEEYRYLIDTGNLYELAKTTNALLNSGSSKYSILIKIAMTIAILSNSKIRFIYPFKGVGPSVDSIIKIANQPNAFYLFENVSADDPITNNKYFYNYFEESGFFDNFSPDMKQRGNSLIDVTYRG